MRKALSISTIFLALGLLVGACNDSNDNGTSPPLPVGALEVRLTDAPTEDVAAVNVFVSGLLIKPSGGPAARVADEIGTFDLLSLQGTTAQLVQLGVAAGDYEFVQIELDQDRSSVVLADTDEVVPLAIASEEIKVLGGFEVPVGGETVVTLDFDAAASLRQLGNGDWLLTPVITQVEP